MKTRGQGVRRALAITLGLGLALLSAAASGVAVKGATAPALPAVAPTLREWTPAGGAFSLRPGSRIVVGPGVQQADADTFRDDLFALTGLRLSVGPGTPEPGDIDLSVSDQNLPASGYTLTIGQIVAISGQDEQGLFYGTQSVEQMLKAAPADEVLPAGTGTDWPALGTRGIMLDLARHFQPVPYLEAQIRMAAWYKLDEVHLHLSDTQGYRLPSQAYPGLPAPQHYSAADIAAIVAYAQRYHVTLVPEVDVPAHSTPLTTADPGLRWTCPSIDGFSYWGSAAPGDTLDITNPATTQVVETLLGEVAAMFPYSPMISIGGDEYASYTQQQNCPELVSYASAHGFASTEDVFTTWQNTLASFLASVGRQTEIWNWWDIVGHATVDPDHSIVVEPWFSHPASSYDGPGGYQVVSAPDDDTPNYFLYVSPGNPPGGPEVPEDVKLYNTWQPATGNPVLLGYESPLWAGPPPRPFAYDQWFSLMPWAVLADRTWGGQKLASVFDFEDVLDQIGAPPGRPDEVPAAQQVLAGTPYGSPSSTSTNAPAEAFDGEPSTSYRSSGDGAYVGIDLGAQNAARVTGVRFVPVPDPNPDSYSAGGLAQSLDLVGAEFQGCTEGPTTGCVDLAGVQWRSTYDWHQLAVTDPGSYRWLRLVSASNLPLDVSEIQFLSAPQAPQQVTIGAPSTLQAGTDTTITATLSNQTALPETFRPAAAITNASDESTLDAQLQGPAAVTVAPGQSLTVSWVVAVSSQATAGTYDIAVRAPFELHATTPVYGAVSAVAGSTLG